MFIHQSQDRHLLTSPTTTRHRVWVYTLRGTRRNPWAWLVRGLLSWLVVKVARQVVIEDAPIFADVQKGLEASAHPGVIGTREERIYAFQKYVLAACGRPHPEGKDGDGALSPLTPGPSPRRAEGG
jgi:hypothetical protein